MSFYGNIKRIPASPWVFDKVYATRADMEDNMSSDNIHIGRYALISYRYDSVNNVYVNKWEEDQSSSKKTTNNKQLNTLYKQNEYADINRYHDTFDLTVWQKIFSQQGEKYILVAELRAGIPRLDLATASAQQVVDGKEIWVQPELIPQATVNQKTKDNFATENVYKYVLPQPLELKVPNSNLLNESLLDMKIRNQVEGEDINPDLLWSPDHNYAKWVSIDEKGNDLPENLSTVTDYTPIKTKRLDMELSAISGAIRSIFDILFGIPENGTGARPGYTDDIAALLGDAYTRLGLVGVLQRICQVMVAEQTDENGKWQSEQLRSYFVTHWGDIEDNADSFIENIPHVITSENNRALGHIYISLTQPTVKEDETFDYLKSTSSY